MRSRNRYPRAVNRSVTAVATYDLAKAAGKTEEEAIAMQQRLFAEARARAAGQEAAAGTKCRPGRILERK